MYKLVQVTSSYEPGLTVPEVVFGSSGEDSLPLQSSEAVNHSPLPLPPTKKT